MRWMKKLLTVWLIYIAFTIWGLIILQSITGQDYSAAFMAITGVGGVELLISGVIKVVESRAEKALKKAQNTSENIEIVD